MGIRRERNPPARKDARPLAPKCPPPGSRSFAGLQLADVSQPLPAPRTLVDDHALASRTGAHETARHLSRLAITNLINPVTVVTVTDRTAPPPATAVSRHPGRSSQIQAVDNRAQPNPGNTGRGKQPQWRLFDPIRDASAAFQYEGRSVNALPQNKRNRSGWKDQSTRQEGLVSQPQPIPQKSREEGKIMILNNPSAAARRPRPIWGSDDLEDAPRMFSGPDTKPISSDQLIAEVKGIYAGLCMVESKCCEVDAKQSAMAKDQTGQYPRLTNEQWQALNSLHRTLLHEHHDFFLASQHPLAIPSLRILATKYSMPQRMWRHGVQSYLELLRHRLPQSLEHMLTFIYLAYSMLTLLYETVPVFQDTWIECLGDLGRYRMAVEDDDIRDRDVWATTSRLWYSKAADKSPEVGRLHHHLAILARPNILYQLFYYCKSLGVLQPFMPSRETILTLFDALFTPGSVRPMALPVDAEFIHLHGINFTHLDMEKFDYCLTKFLVTLDAHISDPRSRWKGPGCYVAVCNIIGLFQYGAKDSILRQACGQKCEDIDEEMEDAPPLAEPRDTAEAGNTLPPLPYDASVEYVMVELPPGHTRTSTPETVYPLPPDGLSAQEKYLNYSKRLAYGTLGLSLKRVGDIHVLPHMHIWLLFMKHITTIESATRLLEGTFPWEPLVTMLNFLLKSFDSERFESEMFPVPEKGVGRPLPEDYILRGLDWSQNYFPERWFENATAHDEERSVELPSMASLRVERILWLASRIAASSDHLIFKNRCFYVHPSLLQRMEMSAVYQSEEVSRLKQQRRLSQQPEFTHEPMTEPMTRSMINGADGLKHQYTILVIDTDLMLTHAETFRLMVSKNWSIAVPHRVVMELLELTNIPGSDADVAKRAILAIHTYVHEGKDVKVVAANGAIINNIGFKTEHPGSDGEHEPGSMDDIIIQTTKSQRAIRSRLLGTVREAEPAMLLSEDVHMRYKANENGVPSIAVSVLHQILSPWAIERKPPGSKRKSIEHPVAAPQQQTGSPPQGQTDGAIQQTEMAGGRMRRQYKRSKTDANSGGASRSSSK